VIKLSLDKKEIGKFVERDSIDKSDFKKYLDLKLKEIAMEGKK